MKLKTKGRVFRLLLCAFLCMAMAVPLTGTALAFDDSGSKEQNITIRIIPPTSWATQRAEVELCVTDNAGNGFESAQVQVGGGSWQDITGGLEQKDNRWYTVVEITENCSVYVKVTDKDRIVYEKSEYIRCFNTAAVSPSPAPSQPSGTDAAESSANPQPSTQPTAQPSTGLTTPPGGQGTVIDNVSGTSEESGREFFTIATPDENVFYLVIDRQKDTENVYFLNAVTESDLMALAEKDTEAPSQSAIPDPEPVCSCKEKCAPGEVNANCPVCVLAYKDCTGTVTAEPDTPEPEQKSDGGIGTIVLVLIAALAVGGAGYYLKIYKPKKELAEADDLDDLADSEEEPTVNEDDLPTPAPASYPEPDEPDYPEGYGDEDDT